MTGAPRISVIMLAHDRKRYVMGGIASAVNQTLPRDRYEILVFKNFQDPEIDAYLERQGVRILDSPPESRPRTMRTVLAEARGEILAFLDDDDRYAPDKLATVDRVFSEDPSLGYFHHDFFVMDDAEKRLERSPFPRLTQRVYIPAGDVRFRALPSNALKIGFNSSSVSVRRDWLPPFLESFERREAELSDAMLLDCALASGCAILADPVQLTYYRYHDSWSNILHYTDESVPRIVDFDTVNIAVLEMVLSHAVGTPLAELLEEGLAYLRFHRSLFVDPPDWSPRARDVLRFLSEGIHQRDPGPAYLIPLYVMSRISRPAAQRAYFRIAEIYRSQAYRSAPGN